MNVFITGGTGFIGTALCQLLVQQQHQVTVLTRDTEAARKLLGSAITLVSHPQAVAEARYDAVINLAGLPIADRRWSEARKAALHQSRIDLTNQLVDALEGMADKPKVLLSASAIGFYGDQGEHWVDESTTPKAEYTHQLCEAWEQAAVRAEDYGVRVCVLRIGLVVGSGGGFLARMLPPFKLGLGGRIGSGQQWMSWVHREDILRMLMYLLAHETLRGPFNGTAPRPVRNSEFTQALAGQLQRPAKVPVPSAALRLAMGEMSTLLLTGQRVAPSRLLEAGFEFHYEQLDAALAEALS